MNDLYRDCEGQEWVFATKRNPSDVVEAARLGLAEYYYPTFRTGDGFKDARVAILANSSSERAFCAVGKVITDTFANRFPPQVRDPRSIRVLVRYTHVIEPPIQLDELSDGITSRMLSIIDPPVPGANFPISLSLLFSGGSSRLAATEVDEPVPPRPDAATVNIVGRRFSISQRDVERLTSIDESRQSVEIALRSPWVKVFPTD